MFGLPPLLAHIAELLTIILLVGIAAGAGLVVLRLLRVAPLLSTGERLLFGTLLGYSTMSMLVLAAGLLRLLYTPVVLGVLAILAAVGAVPLLATLREAAPAFRNALNSLRYPPNLFLAIIVALSVAAALVKALVPPATQDDLMYHFALPRRYIEQHAINFYPDSNYSLFPQIMEMLYTVGLLLGSDRIAILFAFSTGLLATAAAALFAKRVLAERDGHPLWQALPLLVAAIFLGAPLHNFVMRAANTDFAQASAEMLTIYAFYLAVAARPQIDNRLLMLSGICGGISFSVKYYGILLPGALGLALLAIIFTHWRKGNSTEREHIAGSALRNVLAYGVPILAIGGVWLLRNFIESGNPVWPALGNILGGSYWSPAADPEVLLGTIPGLRWESIPSGLAYQYNATLGRQPLPIDNHTYVVNVGPLLLTALFALPLARWKPPLRLALYAATFVWVVSLFYFSRASIRYLATVFLLCSLMGAYGLISVAVRSRIATFALGSVVALALT
ncbi:MAG TPA: glycosyltransferase family 39 protein, partial [Chloroflexia bacterium]